MNSRGVITLVFFQNFGKCRWLPFETEPRLQGAVLNNKNANGDWLISTVAPDIPLVVDSVACSPLQSIIFCSEVGYN